MNGNRDVITVKFITTSSYIFIHDVDIHRYVLGGLKVDSLFCTSPCFVFLPDISTKINFLIHILLERCNQAAIHDPPFSSDFVGFHGNLFNFL